jgi:hypothetical protein
MRGGGTSAARRSIRSKGVRIGAPLAPGTWFGVVVDEALGIELA